MSYYFYCSLTQFTLHSLYRSIFTYFIHSTEFVGRLNNHAYFKHCVMSVTIHNSIIEA